MAMTTPGSRRGIQWRTSIEVSRLVPRFEARDEPVTVRLVDDPEIGHLEARCSLYRDS
jgi:hypothetical protein